MCATLGSNVATFKGWRIRVRVAAHEPDVGAALAAMTKTFVQGHHRHLCAVVQVRRASDDTGEERRCNALAPG